MVEERAPRRRRWTPRLLGATAALVLAASAGAYYTSADSAAEVRQRVEAGRESRGPESGDPTPSARLSGGSRADSRPEIGPGTTAPGILLEFAVAPGDTLDVSETVLLGRPTDAVVLRTPRVRRLAGEFADARPRAREVQLSVDGQPVSLPARIGRKPVTVELGRTTDHFELRYLLAGTTVRSVPSTTGRALVALGSMTRASARRPVVMATRDAAVRNLTCPLLTGDDQACGTREDDAWRVRAPLLGSVALVIVQLDLPAP